MMAPRFKIEPRDAPPAVAAKVLGVDGDEFAACLPDLHARGLPYPDETTSNFDLRAIEVWMDRRSGLGKVAAPIAKDAASVVIGRVAEMSRGPH
jgi:hypothetical protein